MNPTQLFVYGTLRHDQPEHAKYCRGVTGWQPARVRGQLWMLTAGYRIVTLARSAVLLNATADAAGDEMRRAALVAGQEPLADDSGWIEGELLSFRDAVIAWPPLDGWEDFSPTRRTGSYARVVVPVEIGDRAHPRRIAAWMYAATEAPPGATLMSG